MIHIISWQDSGRPREEQAQEWFSKYTNIHEWVLEKSLLDVNIFF